MGDVEDPQPTRSTGGIMDRAKNAFKNVGFMGLLKGNPITLKNLFVSGVTVGLELLFSTEVFDCPVKHHGAYGQAFLFAPVVIVFFANLVILGELSMLTDRACVAKYCRYGDCWGRVLPGIIKACFGPAFWLIASFADTTYYACWKVGQPIENRNITNETEIKILQEKFAHAKSESHVWAWVVFTIVVIVTAIVIISEKCILKDDHLAEDRFSLERREAVAAMIEFQNRTRHLNQEDKDKAKEEYKKYEEITLYFDGTPEKIGQKTVAELFEKMPKKDGRDYQNEYKKFASMYPRVTCGKPWVPWVSKQADDRSPSAEGSPSADGSPSDGASPS